MDLTGLVADVAALERYPAQRIFAGFRVGDPPVQAGLLELLAPSGVFSADDLHGATTDGDAIALAEACREFLQLVPERNWWRSCMARALVSLQKLNTWLTSRAI